MATLASGDIKLCCIAKNDSRKNLNNESIIDIWNSEYYKNARKDFLSGKEIESCSACWLEESQGIESHRIIANREYIKHLGEEQVQRLLDNTVDGICNELPPTLDLRLGNVCNLECVMCQPGDSSKWVSRSKKLASRLVSDIRVQWEYKSKIVTSAYDWYKKEQFWNDFARLSKTIQHITFGGGEPLYIKEHLQLLDYIIENGNSEKVQLLYHTNGTIYDEEIVERWSKFQHVKVMLSIDGLDQVNSYIRRPADWTRIERNLKLYDATQDNITIALNTTVQITNILNLAKFAQWMLDQNYQKVGKTSDAGIFFASVLHYPPYLSIQVLPEQAKQKVTEDINYLINKHPQNKGIQRLKTIVEFMNNKDNSKLLAQTIDFLTSNDSIDDSYSLKMLELNDYINS